jgi:two-component system, OmpR family, response regulator
MKVMQYVIVSIEDDQNLGEYVQTVLSDAGYTVHLAPDGLSGLKLIRSIVPDLVLLDLQLPNIHGESILKDLQNEFPTLPVVILTAQDTPHDVARGLDLGAQDYVTKPFSPEELVARVKARLRSTTQSSNLLQVADLEVDLNTHAVKRQDQLIELTPQEFKLLCFLMNNVNQVLSRESILSRIWATSPDIETRVVDVYVGYLRKKIDKNFEKQLIHSVRGFGYIMKDGLQ